MTARTRPDPHSIWAPVLRPVVHAVQSAGVDPAPLLAQCGIAPEALRDPDLRVPARACFALWDLAVERLDDPDLGIHVAEAERLEEYGILGYALLSSATVGDAWSWLCRFHDLVTAGTAFELVVDGPTATMRYAGPLRPQMPRAVVDEIVVGLVGLWRQTTGADWTPLEVRFAYPRPPRVDEHVRVLRAVPTFGAAHDELVVPASLLSMPQRGADPALAEQLAKRLVDLVPSPGEDPLLGDVRAAVARELHTGSVGARTVARRLAVGERTLRRHLRERGTTFRAIVDEVRIARARRHLGEPGTSIVEVAFALGFSDASAFHRAFRRWTGTTPAAFREAALAGRNGHRD